MIIYLKERILPWKKIICPLLKNTLTIWLTTNSLIFPTFILNSSLNPTTLKFPILIIINPLTFLPIIKSNIILLSPNISTLLILSTLFVLKTTITNKSVALFAILFNIQFYIKKLLISKISTTFLFYVLVSHFSKTCTMLSLNYMNNNNLRSVVVSDNLK